MRQIGILSSSKFLNKIKDDILLKLSLEEQGIKTTILNWEDVNINWNEFETVVIRSTWSYHKKYQKFLFFLEELKSKYKIKIYNSIDYIKWNINKINQLKYFQEQNFNIIPSYFYESKNNFDVLSIIQEINIKNRYDNFVIKPNISGSGDNTFILNINNNNKILQNIITFEEANKKFYDMINNKTISGFIVQPFINAVQDGELSFIFIGGTLTHIVRRFVNIFIDKKFVEEVSINSLDKKIINFANEIYFSLKNISKSNIQPIYSRIDLVIDDNKPMIMEVELIEPDLFFKRILDDNKQKSIIDKFSNLIINGNKKWD